VASFAGRLWLINGTDIGIALRKPDIWASVDGVSWTKEVDVSPWGSRFGHTSPVFDGRLWRIGGVDGGSSLTYYSDVWSSVDGVNWIEETAAGPGALPPR
jgi:hypothetical protein